MTAHAEMKDFVDFWSDRESVNVDPYGNCEFHGEVSYASNRGTVVDTATVRFIRNGYEDGKIRLEETSSLTAESFHLDFSPDFQTYEFRVSDGALVVCGKSMKMGGAYSVTVVPVV
ncbi:hypothetical protein [Paraburkholderia sp. SIMBA_027]|uniref:hypothetical protein n=1 Tax=Paraburkholderia sp. SIMBA_027 TaxID=3085770 RepID=UPI00397B2A64